MTDLNLADAYATCETIIRTHSSSFFHAFYTLPLHERQAVYAVYAFCRRLDSIADEPADVHIKLLQLQEVEKQMAAAQFGTWPDDDSIWVALQDVFSRFPMEWPPFQQMLQGQYADLAFCEPATLSDLEQYSYLVAGTVGLMLLPILAPDRARRLRYAAAALGVAMQLTNILRDVREDALMGRIYLPQNWLSHAGITRDDLLALTPPSGFSAIARSLAARAQLLYEIGLRVWRLYPEHSRFPLLASGWLYGAILEESSQRKWDVFRERVRVSDTRKRELLEELQLHLSNSTQGWRKLIRPRILIEDNPLSTHTAYNAEDPNALLFRFLKSGV